MKFGIMQSVLLKDIESVFGVAARLGFDGVELDWSKIEQSRGTGELRASRRLAIRRRAENAGVVISSVCAGWGNQGGIADLNDDARQRAIVAVGEGITMCAELGAQVLLVPFFGVAILPSTPLPLAGEGGRGEGATTHLVNSLRELAPDAEASNVKLGIETTLPARTVRSLLEQVNSPAVGSYWDMGNAMWLGYDPIQEIRELGSRIVAVHAKEFLGSPTTDPSKVYDGLNAARFGEGLVPVREVIQTLRDIGYDGWITLETAAFGDRFDSAQKALLVLRAAGE